MKKASGFLFVLMIISVSTVFAETGPESNTTISAPKQSNPAHTSQTQTDSPFSTDKINYFAFYGLPWKDYAQIKFQFSAKYQFFNREADLWGVKTAFFFAYSQKSFWSIGKPSRPFEESNYNPEVFFRLRPDLKIWRVRLNEIRISPYEHESNGLAGITSRSWDRRYVELRVGLEPGVPYQKVEAFTPDVIELDFKVWHASGFGDEDAYLRSIGSNGNFLDFAGKGEVRLKIRNIIPWRWDNQLDVSTRVFQASNIYNYEIEFQQIIPETAFSIYLQSWNGYDESLLRFDRDQSKFYTGLSFSY